jgi:cell division protein FtsL
LALRPIAVPESLFRLPLEAGRLLLLRLAHLRFVAWLIDRGWARALPAALLGRIWIAVVAFALIGIVTLQLGLLKLNASIGRGLEHEAQLQRENAALSIENSEIAASARIDSRAQAAGMELVPPGLLRFLGVRPGYDASQAAVLLGKPLGASASGAAETPTSTTPAQTGAPAPSSEPSSAQSATTPSNPGSPGAQAPEGSTSGAPTTAPATETAATSSPESTAGAGAQSPSSPAAGPSVTAPGGSSAEAPSAGGTQPTGAGG